MISTPHIIENPTTHYEQKLNLCFQYDVYFTEDLFGKSNWALKQVFGIEKRKCLVLIDDGVTQAWPQLPDSIRNWIKASAPQLSLVGVKSVHGGESIKNGLGIVDFIGNIAKENGLCRQSYIIAIGGGAVLDAVGYASSIIHRGIRHIRVPTTVLSMNDSGVGVKNGINQFGLKNFYGVFSPPLAVFNDLNFLKTLSDRVWVSGIAEAFKVGIIKDAEFLRYLLSNLDLIKKRDKNVEETIVRRTAELHMTHIAKGGDPFECGSSRPLDFGHWAAHKLESMTDFLLLHGEAVSIGMVLDLHYASLLGFITSDEATHVSLALKKIGLPVYHPYLSDQFQEVVSGLSEFQEHLGGELTLAMPKPLGMLMNITKVDKNLLRKSISLIKENFA